jgi:DNA-binding CsgD family transcriptional regulator
MQTQAVVLTQVIGAIGDKDFAAVAACSVLDWLDFDLATAVLHRRDDKPGLMFDNFDKAGGEEGLQNYVTMTHRLNPVLQSLSRPGAFRARDFRIGAHGISEAFRPYLIRSRDEELGYRTVGWPERLEEIGLYFEVCEGVIELSVYRERGANGLSAGKLRELAALSMPLAAAFERQAVLLGRSRKIGAPTRGAPRASLSPREAEVTEMLLIGCSSEAIALRLGISRHTVKDHRKQVFRKLGVGTLAELFALYRQPV